MFVKTFINHFERNQQLGIPWWYGIGKTTAHAYTGVLISQIAAVVPSGSIVGNLLLSGGTNVLASGVANLIENGSFTIDANFDRFVQTTVTALLRHYLPKIANSDSFIHSDGLGAQALEEAIYVSSGALSAGASASVRGAGFGDAFANGLVRGGLQSGLHLGQNRLDTALANANQNNPDLPPLAIPLDGCASWNSKKDCPWMTDNSVKGKGNGGLTINNYIGSISATNKYFSLAQDYSNANRLLPTSPGAYSFVPSKINLGFGSGFAQSKIQATTNSGSSLKALYLQNSNTQTDTSVLTANTSLNALSSEYNNSLFANAFAGRGGGGHNFKLGSGAESLAGNFSDVGVGNEGQSLEDDPNSLTFPYITNNDIEVGGEPIPWYKRRVCTEVLNKEICVGEEKKPWQWYSLGLSDRVSGWDKESFHEAALYSTENLRANAYQTVHQRNYYYEWVQEQINKKGYDSKWFGAAEIVTRISAIGGVDSEFNADWLFISNDAQNLMRYVNKGLFYENMKNAKQLINTGKLKGSFKNNNNQNIIFDNLSGLSLDYAMVEFEQTNVERLMNDFFEKNPSLDKVEIIKSVNGLFSKSILKSFTPNQINNVMRDYFNEGKTFDFSNYDHRVQLGQRLIDEVGKLK